MKTLGELEAAICEGMRCFEQEYLGRGPADIHAYLRDELLIVRLVGVLTPAERKLSGVSESGKGQMLLKDVRQELVALAGPQLLALVAHITGVRPMTVYHDICTSTGEEFVVFVLEKAPQTRSKKQNPH